MLSLTSTVTLAIHDQYHSHAQNHQNLRSGGRKYPTKNKIYKKFFKGQSTRQKISIHKVFFANKVKNNNF